MKAKKFTVRTLIAMFGFFIISVGIASASYSANIIPAMTSNTTPSGVASASSEGSPSIAWGAFDGSSMSNSYVWRSNGTTMPEWVGYQFADGAKTVAKYGIVGSDTPGLADVKAWDFQGSNDGTNWTTVDSQSGITFVSKEYKEFVISTPGSYSYYRLYITSASMWAALSQLKMFTEIIPVIVPIVSISAASNVTESSATLNADLSNTGGENPARYIQWGTATGVYTDFCDAGVGSAGTYLCDVADLSPETTYYVQAYATNSAGTAYSNEISMTTPMTALAAAKIAAHNVLTDTLGTYTQADYTSENWIVLNTAKTDGDIAIDVAVDLGEVTTAQNTATDAMANVQTIAETPVPVVSVTPTVDNSNNNPTTPEIKKISDESESSLQLTIKTNKEYKNKDLDIKIRVVNIDTGKEETLTYEGEEADSDGELVITIKDLEGATSYRFKVEYSLKNENNYSVWSDFKDGDTLAISLQKNNLNEVVSIIPDSGQNILNDIQNNISQNEKQFDGFSDSLNKPEIKTETEIEIKKEDTLNTQIKEKFLAAAKKISEPLASKTGVVATEVIAVSGVTAILAASPVAASTVATTSFGSLFRTGSMLLGGLIGIGRKRKKWGVVFDSNTKAPLALATVFIFSKDGKLLNKTVTDNNGHFGFLVSAGEYYLEVEKENFVFPSKNSAGEEFYESIYTGGVFRTKEDEVVKLNIPLDGQGIDLREISRQRIDRMFSLKGRINKYLLGALFYGGLLLTAVTEFFVPSKFNTVLFLAYVAIVVYQLFFKRNDFGRVLDSELKKPVSFAIIDVFRKDAPERRIKFIVTDFLGRYYDLIENGEYVLKIKGESLNKRVINTSVEIAITAGVLNGNIVC